MSYPVNTLIPRLRSKIDDITNAKDVIPQDGTLYTNVLSNSPIVSGSDLRVNGGGVYLNHSTFTTGLNQLIPQNNTQALLYSSGNNIVYTIDYLRGEVSFYQGSGYVVGSGLNPFAPWNTANAIFYYQTTKYTDNALANYISFAVADVESALQIGMYVSGVTGAVPVVPPAIRDPNDTIGIFPGDPYSPGQTFVIGEPIEIVQNLITLKAAVNILQRERRIGVGNAIKLKDGDTEIDSSVNQKYVKDYVQDMKEDYENKLKFIMHNMLDGISLRQMDERANQFFYKDIYNGGLANPVDY